MRAPGSWPGLKSIPSPEAGSARIAWFAADAALDSARRVLRPWARFWRDGRMVVDVAITVVVRVHPRASREHVALLPDGSLDVRLRARPVEGQANARLVELLAARLGVRRRDVEIVSGVRSRQKAVKFELASIEELARRLRAHE